MKKIVAVLIGFICLQQGFTSFAYIKFVRSINDFEGYFNYYTLIPYGDNGQFLAYSLDRSDASIPRIYINATISNDGDIIYDSKQFTYSEDCNNLTIEEYLFESNGKYFFIGLCYEKLDSGGACYYIATASLYNGKISIVEKKRVLTENPYLVPSHAFVKLNSSGNNILFLGTYINYRNDDKFSYPKKAIIERTNIVVNRDGIFSMNKDNLTSYDIGVVRKNWHPCFYIGASIFDGNLYIARSLYLSADLDDHWEPNDQKWFFIDKYKISEDNLVLDISKDLTSRFQTDAFRIDGCFPMDDSIMIKGRFEHYIPAEKFWDNTAYIYSFTPEFDYFYQYFTTANSIFIISNYIESKKMIVGGYLDMGNAWGPPKHHWSGYSFIIKEGAK